MQRNRLKLSSGIDMGKKHKWWRVEVHLDDGALLAIEPEMVSGKSDLTQVDVETIRTAAKHLLAFVGEEDIETDFL